MPLKVSPHLIIPDNEIQLTAIRAQGAGGQNVNKVSSAIHLRFDIVNSSLSAFHKERLLKLNDNRITVDGVLIIKAQSHRTQERNKDEAFQRLRETILRAIKVEKTRKKTRPSLGSKKKRLQKKTEHSQKKGLRKKISF